MPLRQGFEEGSMEKTTLQDTLALGDAGKKLIIDYLSQNGIKVFPHIHDKAYQGQSIDFSFGYNKKLYTAFVRTDTKINRSGNIFLETYMHRRGTAPLSGLLEKGWYYTGKANFLCYLDAVSGSLWFFDWENIKRYARDVVVAQCQFSNRIDAHTQGQGYVFPVADIEDDRDITLHIANVDITPLYKFNWTRPRPF